MKIQTVVLGAKTEFTTFQGVRYAVPCGKAGKALNGAEYQAARNRVVDQMAETFPTVDAGIKAFLTGWALETVNVHTGISGFDTYVKPVFSAIAAVIQAKSASPSRTGTK